MVIRTHRNRWLLGVGVMLALLGLGLLVALASPVPNLMADEAPPALESARALTYTSYLPLISHPRIINTWYAEYYSNVSLSGEPVRTAKEARVDYDWGSGAPAGLPANEFSARWIGDWNFERGQYTFFVLADDGVRLWLDDQLLIDDWLAGRTEHAQSVFVASEGLHQLKLEYFEESQQAAIWIHWRRTDLYPVWHADLYREPWVESGWVASQKDRAIQYDWGYECPPGVWPGFCDSFSLGWTAEPLFESGSHRIYLYADDGYQLYVDGSKVSEGGWFDGQGGGRDDVTYDFDVDLPSQHEITYNFHDRGSLAEARLWIEYLEHPYWTAEYFGNKDLGGDPVVAKQEASIFYDWGFGKPHHAMPHSDRFSVRWTGQRYFHAGAYRFGLFVDDGVRLWVDGQLLVDEWQPARAEYHSTVVYLDTGYHDVVVEYFEDAGEAEIRFWWE
jgi:hypothetical protein